MGQSELQKAIEWIHNNTVDNGSGIAISNKQKKLYPEVSGYFIPSLLNIGEIELAESFAKHLCSIQEQNGAWYDAEGETPQIFDSGQILKGLISIRNYLPEVDKNIIRGSDWILSTINEEGRLVQPNEEGRWNDSYCNELIFIYSLSPILDSAKLFNKPEYIEKVNKVLDYYIENRYEQIVNYSLFSHFYAYVLEGLIDCGRADIASEAMNNMVKFQKKNGSIPAFCNVDWICSTAMFQFAIIWYKLGDKKRGDLAYNYACSLQNETGGWYGSYAPTIFSYYSNRLLTKLRLSRSMYLKKEEISWAVKFFLDATYLKNNMETRG